METLKKRIHDDSNGLDYVLVGDYYIPDLKLPEESRPIGRWGRMHKAHLQEHRPGQYNALLLSGKLWTYLADLNERAADRLLDKGVKNVIITLGKIGVYAKTKEFQGIVPAFRVKAVDTTGAGDAFNGGFCAALAEGKSVRDAVSFANALAALSVTRRGTSPAMPYRGEIEKC